MTYRDPEGSSWTLWSAPVSAFCISGTAVPIPGAVWLLGSGLVGLSGLRREFWK